MTIHFFPPRKPVKKCTCTACVPACIFEVSYKVPYSICKQCHRGNHRREK